MIYSGLGLVFCKVYFHCTLLHLIFIDTPTFTPQPSVKTCFCFVCFFQSFAISTQINFTWVYSDVWMYRSRLQVFFFWEKKNHSGPNHHQQSKVSASNHKWKWKHNKHHTLRSQSKKNKIWFNILHALKRSINTVKKIWGSYWLQEQN